MIPNPILKVLFTFQKHKVKALLIGGQACILYGAVEFSKDSDFIVLLNENNLKKLKCALNELHAEEIYVPPIKKSFLRKGHACHFRARAKEANNIRIDILIKLKGCDPFNLLWKRRNKININKNLKTNIISIEDLVQSKKTQRDKDWLMLKRLIEIDILNSNKPTQSKIKWWFIECRTPELLIQLSKKYKKIAKTCIEKRPLIKQALSNNENKLKSLLMDEENKERENDRKYWIPLRKELEQLRHKKSLKKSPSYLTVHHPPS